MSLVDFKKIEQSFQVTMKNTYTIVDKWPLKLKLRPGQPGAQGEFDVLLSSGHAGFERYVEWKRAG